MTNIVVNIERVHQIIHQACERSGRNPQDVTLITVTKGQPIADILQAIEAGEHHFGESRVNEAVEKIEHIADERLHWHLLAPPSLRQVRYVPRLFSSFHALDQEVVAEQLVKFITEDTAPFPVFVEINISGEATKQGLKAYNWEHDSAVFRALLGEIRNFSHHHDLQIQGLMTLAPYDDDLEKIRPFFRSLARLRDALQEELGEVLPDLSMGMTNDYPVAIEEGATFVRVGRAIFGERG